MDHHEPSHFEGTGQCSYHGESPHPGVLDVIGSDTVAEFVVAIRDTSVPGYKEVWAVGVDWMKIAVCPAPFPETVASLFLRSILECSSVAGVQAKAES